MHVIALLYLMYISTMLGILRGPSPKPSTLYLSMPLLTALVYTMHPTIIMLHLSSYDCTLFILCKYPTFFTNFTSNNPASTSILVLI